MIYRHPFKYQPFLENIADYLIFEGIYWKETEIRVLFYDMTMSNSPKRIHNCRKFSMKSEISFVSKCWNECLLNCNILIPAEIIKIDDDGRKEYLTTLRHSGSSLYDIPTCSSNTCANMGLASTNITQDFLQIDLMKDISTEVSVTSEMNNSFTSLTSQVPLCSTPKSFKVSNDSMRNNQTKKTSKPMKPSFTNGDVVAVIHVPLMSTDNEKSMMSATTRLLLKVLGDTPDVQKFDELRKSIKSKNRKSVINREEYDRLTAHFEVKLKIKKDDTKRKIKEIELNHLKDKSLSVLPAIIDSDYNSYEDLVKTLKYINALLKEFKC